MTEQCFQDAKEDVFFFGVALKYLDPWFVNYCILAFRVYSKRTDLNPKVGSDMGPDMCE